MRGPGVAASLLLLAFLLAYGPDVGHGFITDDFRWVVTGNEVVHDLSAAFLKTTGFFRPIVTLSFGLNFLLFDRNAFGYGATNLLLVLISAFLIYRLCRAEQLSTAAALTAAAAWMFNFHGINMAVLWLSGRTSLLATLFALLAALAVQRARSWFAALWCLAALLSKEEAIALPLILFWWLVLSARAAPVHVRLAAAARAGWPLFSALAIYFVLRAQSDAFVPTTAPPVYQFTVSLPQIALNAAHYIDRGCTTSAIIAIVFLLGAWRRPGLERGDRSRVMLQGVVWLVGGYALTVWLPVRSSLYAVFPSVGSAIILAALVDRMWVRLEARARMRVAIAMIALPFVLNPVYRARNVRWVELADLSSAALVDLDAHSAALRAGAPLWIFDDNTTRANIRNAFGSGMEYALQLRYGVHIETHVVNEDAELASRPPNAVTLQLRNSRLVPISSGF